MYIMIISIKTNTLRSMYDFFYYLGLVQSPNNQIIMYFSFFYISIQSIINTLYSPFDADLLCHQQEKVAKDILRNIIWNTKPV